MARRCPSVLSTFVFIRSERQQVLDVDQRDHRTFDRRKTGQEIDTRALRDAGHRLHLRLFERYDVQHAVGEQSGEPVAEVAR